MKRLFKDNSKHLGRAYPLEQMYSPITVEIYHAGHLKYSPLLTKSVSIEQLTRQATRSLAGSFTSDDECMNRFVPLPKLKSHKLFKHKGIANKRLQQCLTP